MNKKKKTDDWKPFLFDDWILVNLIDKKYVYLEGFKKVDWKWVNLGDWKWIDFDNWKSVDLKDWELIDLNVWKLIDLKDGKSDVIEDGKPVDAEDGKPVDAKDGKPVDAEDGKPVDAKDGKPVDAKDGKPVDAKNENVLDLSGFEKVSLENVGTEDWESWKMVKIGVQKSNLKDLQLVDLTDSNNLKLIDLKTWKKDCWEGKKFFEIEPKILKKIKSQNDKLQEFISTHQENLKKEKLKKFVLVNWSQKKYVLIDNSTQINWIEQDLMEVDVIKNSVGFNNSLNVNLNSCILINREKKLFFNFEDWKNANNWDLVNFNDWKLVEIARNAEKELLKRFHEIAEAYAYKIKSNPCYNIIVNRIETFFGKTIMNIINNSCKDNRIEDLYTDPCIENFIKDRYTIKLFNNEIVFIYNAGSNEQCYKTALFNEKFNEKPVFISVNVPPEIQYYLEEGETLKCLNQHSSNNIVRDSELIKLYQSANKEIINRLKEIAKNRIGSILLRSSLSTSESEKDSWTESLSNFYYNSIIVDKKFKKRQHKSGNIAGFITYIINCRLDDEFRNQEIVNRDRIHLSNNSDGDNLDRVTVQQALTSLQREVKLEKLYSPFESQMRCLEILLQSDNRRDSSSDSQPERVTNVADENEESSGNSAYDTWLQCMNYYINWLSNKIYG